MALKIRLKRMGTLKKPFNRIIVCDTRIQRDGRAVEEIGIYDPAQNPYLIKVNKERALYWLGKGAVLSDTVKSLFKKSGIPVEKKKKKKKKKTEEKK